MALKRKCDSLELSNERVLNRLCHVKKYMHRLSRERRGLAKKLTELGDEYKKSDLTVPLEDDLPGNMIGASDSPPSSLPATGESLGDFSPSGSLLGGGLLRFDETGLLEVAAAPPPTTVNVKSGRKKRSREVGKSEKEKDPNAPKKPANAFLMYCQQERQKVQDGEGNGIYSADLSHQDLTRQLAKQWKFLSEEDKKHYYQLYEKEKDRYDKAVKKYAKAAGGDKKNTKRDEDKEMETETIDVVKMGQDEDKKKDLKSSIFSVKEEKITLKAARGNEDQNVDVEKDEFEFTDYPIVVDEPKICLEKIDKSKLFDKARLFGLTNSDYGYGSQRFEQDAASRKPAGSGTPVKDLLAAKSATDMRMFPNTTRADLKGAAILDITGVRKSASPTILSHTIPRVLTPTEPHMRPSLDVSIKEIVQARPGASFEITNPAMMELKSKAEEQTVLASALRNKPNMFDMRTRSSFENNKPKYVAADKPGPLGDTMDYSRDMATLDAKSKIAVEIRSRMSADQLDIKMPMIDSKPKAFGDTKSKPAVELRSKPVASGTKSPVPGLDSKVKPSPEASRRMSLENKKPVVELKKIHVDPSDDPYHFDD